MSPGECSAAPWRDGGVYLISGGAGALGLLLVEEIVSRSRGAHLVLLGRKPLDSERQDRIGALRRDGCNISYHQVDVSDRNAVDIAVGRILEQHGTISGVLCLAGIARDAFLIEKVPGDMAAVLAPKVSGTVNIDEATAALPLEFFACFASFAGTVGNVGQADYASANAFMDRYAGYRNELVARGLRSGRSLAIDWPWWAGGGMRIDAAKEERLRLEGQAPLEVDEAMAAFYRALASDRTQIIVLKGDHDRMRELLRDERIGGAADSDSSKTTSETLRDVITPSSRAVADYLRNLLARRLHLAPERIETDAALEHYGIDSILALQLVSALEEVFGPLRKTLFFE
ncbi:MAG: beta-ketoacyl reductase, partial [Steroidobacteraceae bacterium]